MNYTKSPITAIVASGHTNNIGGSGNIGGPYSCNTPFGLKTVEGGSGVINSVGSSICPSSSLTNVANSSGGNSGIGIIPGEGPPTPTQELDLSGTAIEQQRKRKLLYCTN